MKRAKRANPRFGSYFLLFLVAFSNPGARAATSPKSAPPVLRAEVGTTDGTRDPGDFEVLAVDADGGGVEVVRLLLEENSESGTVIQAKWVTEESVAAPEMEAEARVLLAHATQGQPVEFSAVQVPKPLVGTYVRSPVHRRVMTVLRFFGVGAGVFLSLHEGAGVDLQTSFLTATLFGSMSAALQYLHELYQRQITGFFNTHRWTDRALAWFSNKTAPGGALHTGIDALRSLFLRTKNGTDSIDVLRNWWLTEVVFIAVFKLALLANGALGEAELQHASEWVAGGLAQILGADGALDSQTLKHLLSVAEGATMALFSQGFLDSSNAKYTLWKRSRSSEDKHFAIQTRSDGIALGISTVSNALVVASMMGLDVAKMGVLLMGASGVAAYAATYWATVAPRKVATPDASKGGICEDLFVSGELEMERPRGSEEARGLFLFPAHLFA